MESAQNFLIEGWENIDNETSYHNITVRLSHTEGRFSRTSIKFRLEAAAGKDELTRPRRGRSSLISTTFHDVSTDQKLVSTMEDNMKTKLRLIIVTLVNMKQKSSTNIYRTVNVGLLGCNGV